MVADIAEAATDIVAFLSSLRHAVDRSYRDLRLTNDGERQRFTRMLLSVEEARIQFRTLVRSNIRPSKAEWAEACLELIGFVDEFLTSKYVDDSVYDLPFRIASPRERFSSFQMKLNDRKPTVADALIDFRKFLQEAKRGESKQEEFTFKDLDRIVPPQQVAPVQFSIVDGKIVISDRAPRKNLEDRENIQAALEHLRDSGKNIIENLERSNCDNRLLENIKELHGQIVREDNVVKLGLTNLGCGVMCNQFAHELPDALNAMINAYTATVSMYVAQFPEWEQFTQKAASIELDNDDVQDIAQSAEELISSLELNPEISDPEVPKTIKFLRELISRPGSSSKRAAFAMMRTIENLVSSVLRYSIAFVHKTADKTIDKLSTAASHVITSLLGIALLGATGISMASASAGTPWVKQAAEIVQKQIENLNKVAEK